MMRLPDTENAHELYAFKKGYRTAKAGLAQTFMPSQIRYEANLRDYFVAGYEQYQADLAESTLASRHKPWRQRLAWWVMMALAGLATAGLMLHNIESERSPDAPSDANLASTTPEPANTVSEASPLFLQTTPSQMADSANLAADTTPDKPESAETKPKLSLISDQARQDLSERKQDLAKLNATHDPVPPVTSSSVDVRRMTLARSVQSMEPTGVLNHPVPKYVRRIVFFTEVVGAKGQTLTHHWYHRNRSMAEIELDIGSDRFRTWSSKRLSSAWAGPWRIDIENERGEVIERFEFVYIAQNQETSGQ
ncbi:DUF2914 domain-containing protein [Thiomicrospira sp. WB1]|uniref:DUF2914 domain-containing protein n=1 Tax=Thiomicrospira sp. WB1 TaxID=1685380 RepID=UPI00074A6ADD|nr:DUF2914 domain-containing protein [Thiomicrospira sp. WB1]KUJ71303.1 hypothetical protein AVO41_07135 [Thiomicrospira sp. WB1]